MQKKLMLLPFPIPDCTFDIVLCNHVLQQVPDHHRAMREIRRVIKPNGWGIIQVPIASKIEVTLEDSSVVEASQRRKMFGSINHLRIYGLDYANQLANAGFKVQATHPYEDGWCKDAAKHAVNSEEKIYVVRP